MNTALGVPLFDVVEHRAPDGQLVYVEATSCPGGERRAYLVHQLEATVPARRKTDPENRQLQ